MQGVDSSVNGIEGENDFSGKRYVWLRDPQAAFVKGWIVEELPDSQLLVQCDDGSVSDILIRERVTNNTYLSNVRSTLKG